jgi:hypothetical protein
MKQWSRIGIGITMLILFSLACQFLTSDTLETTSGVLDDGLLFADDFSDPNSGWDQFRDGNAITDYEDGGYRISVNEDNTDFFANPGKNFGDVVVEVTADKIGGPDDNNFGVICRYQDEENFYWFSIGSDGFYGIGSAMDGEYQMIGMEAMEFSGQINQGQAQNEIRAECIGDRLTLYANGTILADVNDNRLQTGDVGLIAGTFDEIGTDILFDDFTVRQP